MKLFSLGLAFLGCVACGVAAPAERGGAPEDAGSGERSSAPIDLRPSAADARTPEGTCKAEIARAKVVPLHLVTVLDRSQSMVLNYWDASGRRTTRLKATVAAIEAYAARPQRSPVLLSVIPFGSKKANLCDLDGYSAVVHDAMLPDTTGVPTALGTIGTTGLTPTSAAVRAGLRLAQSLHATYPDDNVALLLATDGLPTDCGQMPEALAAVREARALGVVTHVVGIGEELGPLNQLANAGGSDTAVLIAGTNASDVASALGAKLENIRSEFSCDIQLPALQPDGAPVNMAELNVRIAAGATPTDLVYSQTCAAADAFRYDDPRDPKKVVLCARSCEAVRADANAHVELLFDCATRVQ